MVVFEYQRFDAWVIIMVLHGGAYGGDILFMEYFVPFEIKCPIPAAIVMRDHFLLCIDKTAIHHLLIPVRFNNPYAWILNSMESFQGVIFSIPDGNHEFVAQWQYGKDTFYKRITKLGPVS